MEDARARVQRILDNCAEERIHEWGTIKTRVKEDLSRLLFERTAATR